MQQEFDVPVQAQRRSSSRGPVPVRRCWTLMRRRLRNLTVSSPRYGASLSRDLSCKADTGTIPYCSDFDCTGWLSVLVCCRGLMHQKTPVSSELRVQRSVLQAMKQFSNWEAREERKFHADLLQEQRGVLFVGESYEPPPPDNTTGVLQISPERLPEASRDPRSPRPLWASASAATRRQEKRAIKLPLPSSVQKATPEQLQRYMPCMLYQAVVTALLLPLTSSGGLCDRPLRRQHVWIEMFQAQGCMDAC